MSQPVTQKITTMLGLLNQGLVERDAALKAALLTLLAGENLILVGPPGTAKSLIARRMAETLKAEGEGDSYFEYLLTKFSTPEEIFGPLSIAELKADRFKRNTAGYLPTVRIAFLDEIFKASSSILNALLTILNERKFHNGAKAEDVKLQALVAASNELPTGQEELSALYDRFLMRIFVDYVSEDGLERLFEPVRAMPVLQPFTEAELAVIRQAAEAVTIPAEIVQAVRSIWRKHREAFKEDSREQLSDRRLKKVIHLLRVSAATNGRQAVDLSDVVLLKDCLWNVPENAGKVREVIFGVLRGLSYGVPVAADSAAGAVQKTLVAPVKSASGKSVVKGYRGSGTKEDPILIENIHHLAGLEKPEVGQKGYYFRQTVDIDCTSLTTWFSIEFKGYYDGGGFSVTYRGNSDCAFFNRLMPNSGISNLRVENLMLATYANGSDVVACTSAGSSLIGVALDSRIIACKSDSSIANNASQCEVKNCQSHSSLILEMATSCTIQDCLVDINWAYIMNKSDSPYRGGLASTLKAGCSVERVMVTGEIFQSGFNICVFSGIAAVCADSIIKHSAVGQLSYHTNVFFCGRTDSFRICKELQGTSSLSNNIALDIHPGTSDAKGKDGKSISAALFTQHYFEHTLDWDFTEIWQWDAAKGHPVLQSVGIGAKVPGVQTTPANAATDDLLAQQMRTNLWL